VIVRGQIPPEEALKLALVICPSTTLNIFEGGKHRKMRMNPNFHEARGTIFGFGECQNDRACITRIPGQHGIEPEFVLTKDSEGLWAMCGYCQREFPIGRVFTA